MGTVLLWLRKLLHKPEFTVGISSGANFIGALKFRISLDLNQLLLQFLPTITKKYLSTDLLRDEPVKNDYLSKDIEIIVSGLSREFCLSAAILKNVPKQE